MFVFDGIKQSAMKDVWYGQICDVLYENDLWYLCFLLNIIIAFPLVENGVCSPFSSFYWTVCVGGQNMSTMSYMSNM